MGWRALFDGAVQIEIRAETLCPLMPGEYIGGSNDRGLGAVRGVCRAALFQIATR